MKAFKYCEYERCKNYKKRDLKLCYVHERKTKSTSSTITLQLFFIITTMITMYAYIYVEDFNVYVNTTLNTTLNTTFVEYIKAYDYDKYAYEIVDIVNNTLNNVYETCIRVYSDFLQDKTLYI